MSLKFHLPDEVNCNNEKFRVFITKEQIDERLAQLGTQLDKKFEGKRPIFIGVLNGAFIFLADIMRHVSIDCEVDFMKLSSYGDEKVSSGQVTELKHVDANLEGRHVILVEDIVDTGLSINFLVKRVKEMNPASVSVLTLLHKKDATRHDVQLDYVGFEIPDAFVLGYGLDYAQEGRNLAQIYVIESHE
ncbi:hypoxanthine phosphoribosyltransferase [Balneola sp. MJW-20]|uniref:hypoxanthine phosphoribosyltransferase n=1 Tax=Gracilimonas aurantiaca TaxID=3234185 RepID=UPI003467323F